jgi:hypothetical protein
MVAFIERRFSLLILFFIFCALLVRNRIRYLVIYFFRPCTADFSLYCLINMQICKFENLNRETNSFFCNFDIIYACLEKVNLQNVSTLCLETFIKVNDQLNLFSCSLYAFKKINNVTVKSEVICAGLQHRPRDLYPILLQFIPRFRLQFRLRYFLYILSKMYECYIDF